MTTEQKELHAEKLANLKKWAADHFAIEESEIVGYNNGICYSKIWVTNEATAKKISNQVKDKTVNGGWYDGRNLGAICKYNDTWEVMV